MTKTVLVTGFSPFPGTPINPTSLLVQRLKKRLPHHMGTVRFHYAILPTTWAGRQEAAGPLRRDLKPDAIVHFGADGSRPQINVETHAVNRATQMKPDAIGAMAPSLHLETSAPASRMITLAPQPLLAALKATGVKAQLSNDAGIYLCNATLWDSIGSGIPSIFVHVPNLSQGKADKRLALADLERAASTLLRTLARGL